MRTIYLVSCVAKKATAPTTARDLYRSPWFLKARAFIEASGEPWFILSAKHGVLAPDAIVAPYNTTLNDMHIDERRLWADRSWDQLAPKLNTGDRVVFLAGESYRRFLVKRLERAGIPVEIPMEGLGIGHQLRWLSQMTSGGKETPRQADLKTFYELMAELEQRLGGCRVLRETNGRMEWPRRGVYFFFEDGEVRRDSGVGMRITRVGTHGVSRGSKTTLWNRLSQHRGSVRSGGGSHRSSVFRRAVGHALIRQEELTDYPDWGNGSSASKATRDTEHSMETQVSRLIGEMSFLWLGIDDEPSPGSMRSYIERNAIALLSNWLPQNHGTVDGPSRYWLGHHAHDVAFRHSGLWNNKHIKEKYDPIFLESLADYVRAT